MSTAAILHHLQLADGILPVNGGYVHQPAESTAEPLLYADDRPVFFRCAYGKGEVYVMSIPLEESIGNSTDFFPKETAPRADAIYRTVAKRTAHAVDSRNRAVCLTEHPLDNTRRVVVAINYSGKPQTADLQFDGKWRLAQVYRGTVCENRVELAENDAAVFLLTQ